MVRLLVGVGGQITTHVASLSKSYVGGFGFTVNA